MAGRSSLRVADLLLDEFVYGTEEKNETRGLNDECLGFGEPLVDGHDISFPG